MIRRNRYWLILLLLALFSCRREEDLTLLQRLQRIPGIVDAAAIAPPAGYAEAFQVVVAQRVDHERPERGEFRQLFYLSFRSETAPTVFYTSGYGISRNYESEPAALLQANQVLMVHRYFPGAVPSANDWSLLNTRQAAADQHEIRVKLGEILTGKWLSSGASKGGMTALFYRYYYPQDVEATVAYVAPVMERPDDPRFVPFLRQAGTAACREQDLRPAAAVPRAPGRSPAPGARTCPAEGISFTSFSEAQAFEYAVLEYPFAFWQYGNGDCAALPGADATAQELFDHLVAVSPLSYYSDDDYIYFRPLFYQAYTEIGYCPYVFDHLAGLLQAVPAPDYRAFAPRVVPMTFRPEVMAAIAPWLRSRGERIVYIYGGNDPWTAAALRPDPGLDALCVIQPGANHGVKIRNLDDKGLVIAALERWLGIDHRLDEAGIHGS